MLHAADSIMSYCQNLTALRAVMSDVGRRFAPSFRCRVSDKICCRSGGGLFFTLLFGGGPGSSNVVNFGYVSGQINKLEFSTDIFRQMVKLMIFFCEVKRKFN